MLLLLLLLLLLLYQKLLLLLLQLLLLLSLLLSLLLLPVAQCVRAVVSPLLLAPTRAAPHEWCALPSNLGQLPLALLLGLDLLRPQVEAFLKALRSWCRLHDHALLLEQLRLSNVCKNVRVLLGVRLHQSNTNVVHHCCCAVSPQHLLLPRLKVYYCLLDTCQLESPEPHGRRQPKF